MYKFANKMQNIIVQTLISWCFDIWIHFDIRIHFDIQIHFDIRILWQPDILTSGYFDIRILWCPDTLISCKLWHPDTLTSENFDIWILWSKKSYIQVSMHPNIMCIHEIQVSGYHKKSCIHTSGWILEPSRTSTYVSESPRAAVSMRIKPAQLT